MDKKSNELLVGNRASTVNDARSNIILARLKWSREKLTISIILFRIEVDNEMIVLTINVKQNI